MLNIILIHKDLLVFLTEPGVGGFKVNDLWALEDPVVGGGADTG